MAFGDEARALRDDNGVAETLRSDDLCQQGNLRLRVGVGVARILDELVDIDQFGMGTKNGNGRSFTHTVANVVNPSGAIRKLPSDAEPVQLRRLAAGHQQNK